ncbi:hypothetical protein ACOME3_001607 [Neoechinorhynchus agilis]
MPNLKDLNRRLRSITSIQKITKSMRMVAASKYARAEREFRSAKVFGEAALDFYSKSGIVQSETRLNEPFSSTKDDVDRLLILMSSDRGLCGGIHAGIARMIRNKFQRLPGQDQINDSLVSADKTRLIIIGDKIKTILQRQFASSISATVSEVGKRALTFDEAAQIARLVLDEATFSKAETEIIFNCFRTVLSYSIRSIPVMSGDKLRLSSVDSKLGIYDSVDSDILRMFQEFQLASLIYYAFKQNFTSELASRMNAMEGATKNAGELIDALRLQYNRTRQFVITRELIEIISGASALKGSSNR